MTKKIGVLIVTILGGALLVYSATRSLDFIALTLPADRQILAYFGLAALDGGIIAWLLSYLYGSRGGWQRAISVLMLIVDVVGAIAMFTLDTLYNTGKNGMTTQMSPETITNAVLALSAIIALNIIATIAHHVTEPDKMREQAEEEAFSKVEEAALKQISKNADALAAKLAPTMAADWMNQTEARYMSYLGTGKMPTIDVTPQNVPMPVMLPDNQNQKPGINLVQFLPAWLMGKFNRQYESAVTSHVENLNVAPKAQAESTQKDPTTEYQAPTPKPREGLHFPMWEKPGIFSPVSQEALRNGGDKAEAQNAPFEDNEPKQE